MTFGKVIRVFIVGLVLATVPALSAMNAAVDKKQKEQKEAKGKKAHKGKFHDQDIEIIRGYFGKKEGLPPGLAKKDTLPPGLEKQLRERGTLPPGLEKRMQLLPADLEKKLPRLPERQRRVVIGRDVVLLDTEDDTILDVLEDVFGER